MRESNTSKTLERPRSFSTSPQKQTLKYFKLNFLVLTPIFLNDMLTLLLLDFSILGDTRQPPIKEAEQWAPRVTTVWRTPPASRPFHTATCALCTDSGFPHCDRVTPLTDEQGAWQLVCFWHKLFAADNNWLLGLSVCLVFIIANSTPNSYFNGLDLLPGRSRFSLEKTLREPRDPLHAGPPAGPLLPALALGSATTAWGSPRLSPRWVLLPASSIFLFSWFTHLFQ